MSAGDASTPSTGTPGSSGIVIWWTTSRPSSESAVNDALAPLGLEISTLPMRVRDLEALIASKRG
jgi:hypothetical protein